MATLLEQLFGWKLKNVKEEPPAESFTPEVKDDGAVIVNAGGAYGTYVDLEGTAKTDVELINRYRQMAMQPEVDRALDDILNEAIVTNEDYIVKIVLDKCDTISDGVKKKIEGEFDYLLGLLEFNDQAYETFRKWYIDGRLYYHVILDEKDNLKNGIRELRYIDPRKIRKVREIQEVKKEGGYSVQKSVNEYYVYNERGLAPKSGTMTSPTNPAATGLRISKDAILYTTSGLTDENNNVVLSHLHKAIKPLNSLRVLEDAVVIYRISRAPERRVFKLDVGNLPNAKAEQYTRETMARHKNRLVYDQNTGEIRDDRKYMTMQEDYWFPVRDGGKGTDVITLPAGSNLGELTDVEYMQKKLYMSLAIPVSRLEPDLGMTLGRSSEISRDEVKFSKFVGRMRKRFSQLFLKLLEKQLVMRNIILPEEWPEISRRIEFDYVEDNHFAELKNLEILTGRAQAMQTLEPYIGKIISWDWCRREVMKQTDDDIEAIDMMIEEEAQNPMLLTPQQMEIQAMLQQQDAAQAAEAEMNLGEPTGPQDEPEADEEQQALEDGNIGEPIAPPPGAKKDDKPKPKAKKK